MNVLHAFHKTLRAGLLACALGATALVPAFAQGDATATAPTATTATTNASRRPRNTCPDPNTAGRPAQGSCNKTQRPRTRPAAAN